MTEPTREIILRSDTGVKVTVSASPGSHAGRVGLIVNGSARVDVTPDELLDACRYVMGGKVLEPQIVLEADKPVIAS